MVEDVVEERRAYAVVRDDLPLTRTAYLALSALGYSRVSMLCAERPHLMDGYDRDMQPKLALRAKNAGLLSKAEEALRSAGVPFVAVEHGGEPAALFLPPMPRSALPREVAGLQLFAERRNPVDEEEVPVSAGEGDQACPIMFRAGLEAPLGKMMAQVGHAAWGAGSEAGDGGLRVLVVGTADRDVREAQREGGWQSIVDAGRTVFGEPTLTCIWGGVLPEPHGTLVLDARAVPESLPGGLKP